MPFNCHALNEVQSLALRFVDHNIIGQDAWHDLIERLMIEVGDENSQWVELRQGSRDQSKFPEEPPVGAEVILEGPSVESQIDLLRPFSYFLATVRGELRDRRPHMPCTLFVSHQSSDKEFAERAAYIATTEGFDYWLDIHDPWIAAVSGIAIPQPYKAIVVAAIVEIALANTTHILALHTANSVASRWVPYEFGAAKRKGWPFVRVPSLANAASWFSPKQYPTTHGDYLYLSPCLKSENDIRAWLMLQRRSCKTCVPAPKWSKNVAPVPLPIWQ